MMNRSLEDVRPCTSSTTSSQSARRNRVRLSPRSSLVANGCTDTSASFTPSSVYRGIRVVIWAPCEIRCCWLPRCRLRRPGRIVVNTDLPAIPVLSLSVTAGRRLPLFAERFKQAGPRGGAQLGEDVRQVGLHGPDADEQRFGDLLVGAALADQ